MEIMSTFLKASNVKKSSRMNQVKFAEDSL